jgi:menaquinone-dependent protoporphyrinogen oxidase
MSRILVVYGTTEGHTRKIAEFIGEKLRARGHVAQVIDSASPEAKQVQLTSAARPLRRRSAPPWGDSPQGEGGPPYDGVILGGSLHQGKHQSALAHFIRDNAGWINGLPNAFFSVSLSMASANADEREEAREIAREFVDASGLNAGIVYCAAGALLYTKYDYFKRFIMRRIAEKEGGEVDTSQDHEYTDWNALAGFVEDYLAAAGFGEGTR